VAPLQRLRHRDHGRWLLEPGAWKLLLARDAADPEPLVAEIRL
jgi:hypothetical protein